MAGHEHGVAVRDFAYVGGKIPTTEEEWTNVQVAPGRGSRQSQKGSIADSSSLLGLDADKLPAEDANLAEKKVNLRQDRPMSVGDKYQLQPTVYESPNGGVTRVIAKDVEAIFVDANDGDGGGESSSRTKLTLPQSTSPTFPKDKTKDGDTDEQDDMIRGDLYFPTYMPSSKSSKKDSETTGHKCKTSTTLLQRISARIPKLTFTEDERGHLNRDFQFPPPSHTPAFDRRPCL